MGDVLDKAMKLLIGVLFVCWVLCRWIAPGTALVGYLNNPEVPELFERGLVVVLVGWGLIWLPFRHVEQLTERHAREMKEIVDPQRARIAKLEEQARPKFTLICQRDVEACSLARAREGFHLVRLLVRNDSPSQGVTDCKVRLKSVYKDGKVLVKHVIWDLPESNARNIAGVTILGGQEGSWDLLCIATNVQPQRVCLPTGNGAVTQITTASGDLVFKDPGDYVLGVEVYAAGPGRSGNVRFKWSGDCKEYDFSLTD